MNTDTQTQRLRVGCLTFFDPMSAETTGSLVRPYGIGALEDLGFELVHLPVDWSRGHPLRDVEAVHRVTQNARNLDVVFAMFESQANTVALARALRIPGTRRTPLVVLSCWLGDQVLHASSTRLHALRIAYRSVDRLLFLSTNQQALFHERLGVDSTKLAMVPFGVDIDWFGSAPVTNDGSVVSVGRDRGRDWPTLFAAFEGTGLKVRVACRPAELRGLCVPDEVEVLGFLPRDDYRTLLSGAELVVIPTHDRAYPTGQSVALEAMAMGKCVIATATAAISDYLSHDNTAVLVPEGDVSALRAAILATLKDPQRRRAIGDTARETVAAKFGAGHMWAAIGKVLSETVAEHRGQNG